MTEKEIYNNSMLLKVEETLLDVAWSSTSDKEQETAKDKIVRKLLEARKSMINEMLVMDESYEHQLKVFADMLLQEIIRMREETRKLFNALTNSQNRGTLTAVGKCLLSPGDELVWQRDRNLYSMEVWKAQCRCLADSVEKGGNPLVFRCDDSCHDGNFASENINSASVADYLLSKQPFTMLDLIYAHDIVTAIHIEEVTGSKYDNDNVDELD